MDIISIQADIAKQGLDLGGVMALAAERTLTLVGADGAAIERIQQETTSPFPFEGRELHLSASIGAAAFPDDATHVEHLIELADQRMYEIKRRHHQHRR